MTIGERLDYAIQLINQGYADGFCPAREWDPRVMASAVPPIAFISHQVFFNAIAPVIMHRAICPNHKEEP